MAEPRQLRVNWILPRANLAGGTKSNRLIAEALGRRGHEVTIAYLRPRRGLPSLLQPRRFLRELPGYFRPLPPHHLERCAVNTIEVLGRRIAASDVPDADVTIATWWETMEWIRDWPIEKGRHAYFVRGHELHGGPPDRVRATYRQKALKLVISNWLKNLMASAYGDPEAVLVPNGLDRGQFDSKPRGKRPVPTVGMLYGPQPLKGAAVAFQAFRIAKARLKTMRMISFGSRSVKRGHNPPCDLEHHVRPAQATIAEVYRSTDCWVISSTTEGFGMPGLEAAACRCPIVSTDCGGPADFVVSGVNGYLVEVGDAEALAERILEVVTAPEDRWREMSEASYRISLEFDWDRSAEILEKALLEYVTTPRTPA